MATGHENLQLIQERIAAACQRSGRDPTRVQLLAVSKTRSAEEVALLAAAGQRLFGENRVQEARDKIPLVAQADDFRLDWHLIGPLQRNKVKMALPLFQMIHSLDSLALAREIQQEMENHPPMPVLLQINIGREPQKHGFAVEECEAALRIIGGLSGLAVRGLMAIPPLEAEGEAARPYFRQLATLAERLRRADIPGIALEELSMGMSHDFEVAVEEGATLVRIGSALFGPRGL